MDSLQYINAVWSLVGIYWVVGLVFAKRAVKRESILSSAMHVALGCAAAAEEKFMREEFSAEYARYAQRVRRLIPFVF
jgi:protein-S-isoprenylcysteine O-methyltransferase Ste14